MWKNWPARIDVASGSAVATICMYSALTASFPITSQSNSAAVIACGAAPG